MLRSISVSGAVVTGQFELRNNASRSRGIDHVLVDFIALVPASQITLYAALSDVADPQTAFGRRHRRGHAAGGHTDLEPGSALRRGFRSLDSHTRRAVSSTAS